MSNGTLTGGAMADDELTGEAAQERAAIKAEAARIRAQKVALLLHGPDALARPTPAPARGVPPPNPASPTPPAYRGVAPAPDGRWRATVTNAEGRTFDLGSYPTAAMAAQAYDDAVYWEHGPDAPRNFPDRTPGPPRCATCKGQVGKDGRCHRCTPASRRTRGPKPGTPTGPRQGADHGFKGATRDRGKWRGQVYVDNRTIKGPPRATPAEAARDRDALLAEHRPEARPEDYNFPAERAMAGESGEGPTRARAPKGTRPVRTPSDGTPAPPSLRQQAELLGRLADLLDGLDGAERAWLVEAAARDCGLAVVARGHRPGRPGRGRGA